MVSEDLPHPAAGGLAKHVLLLAKAMVRAGHLVDLMGNAEHSLDCMVTSELPPGDFFPDLAGAHKGWKERQTGIFNPMRRALLARQFAQAILSRSAGYDVIHYHGHVPDVAAFIPERVNFVQTRHDQGADCLRHTRFRDRQVCAEISAEACARCAATEPNGLQRAISTIAVTQFRKRVAKGFKRHKTIFVSDMLGYNLSRSFGGGPNEWGRTIHNFIDWAELSKHAVKIREIGVYTIIVAGKLSHEKGVDAFLAAFAPKMKNGTEIIVAGNGPLEDEMRTRFADERIHFLGWCTYPLVLELTGKADCAVVPSICEESCATTVLEALSLGRPVFALNRGGTPELSRYERFPGQLKLFDSLESLACTLAEELPAPRYYPPTDFAGCDVSLRVPELLAAYMERRG